LSATNSFTVVVREVNVAPVLQVIPDQTINELALLTVTNTAFETNIHATLGYVLVNPPAEAAIDANGIITWTPSQNQSPGTNTITTVVTNSDPNDLVNPHLSATNSFTVMVREVNVAPVLQVIPDQTINELALLTVTNTAFETNIHAALGYSLVDSPAGAAIDANGIITWTPNQNQSPGTNTIITVVTNTDPFDLVNPHLSATDSFTVIVREVNVAPVLPVIPDQTVNELSLLTVTNTAFETNIHAALGYTLVNPPAAAAIDANGIITWTPSQNQSPGTNTITTVVTNSNPYDLVNPHLSATNFFRVFLQAPPRQPVIESITLSTGMATLKWDVVVGRNYRLQYKDSLIDTNWNDLLPDVTATGLEATVTAPITGSTQRFYRVFLVP
jgi:5,10-methenyltetrahydromethanopterin hydrogenase